MKECIEYQSLIPEYLDGELESSLCREFEVHIEECPSCKNALEEMRLLFADISASAHDVPAELKEGVMSRIAADVHLKNKKKKSIIRILGGAAACFVVAVGVMSVLPHLGESIVGNNKSEFYAEDAAPECEGYFEYSNTSGNFDGVADEDVVEDPSEIAPENTFVQDNGSSSEKENEAVGSAPGTFLPDGAVADSAEDEDSTLSAGNTSDIYGDTIESPDGNESDEKSTLDEVVTTDLSSYEDVEEDYGTLFMCRGAASLAELLEEEE